AGNGPTRNCRVNMQSRTSRASSSLLVRSNDSIRAGACGVTQCRRTVSTMWMRKASMLRGYTCNLSTGLLLDCVQRTSHTFPVEYARNVAQFLLGPTYGNETRGAQKSQPGACNRTSYMPAADHTPQVK